MKPRPFFDIELITAMPRICHGRARCMNEIRSSKSLSFGGLALIATEIGAVAIAAFAIGALAIGRLARSTRFP